MPGRDGEPVVHGQSQNAEYLSDFQMKKLLGQALEMVKGALESGEGMMFICPTCKEPIE